MTKGWSRLVKEKKLDAGDIVSFQRGVGGLVKDRLFIDWRRLPDTPDLPPSSIPHHFSFHHHRSLHHPWSPLFIPLTQAPPRRDYSHLLHTTTHHHYHHPSTGYGPYTYGSMVNGNPYPPGIDSVPERRRVRCTAAWAMRAWSRWYSSRCRWSKEKLQQNDLGCSA